MGNAMGPEEKSSGPGLEALGRLQAHQQAWQECGHKSYRTQMICQLEHVSEQMDEVRRLLKCEPMSHGSVEVQLAEVQRLKKEHKLDLLLRERKLKKEQQAQKREEKKKERKAAPKAAARAEAQEGTTGAEARGEEEGKEGCSEGCSEGGSSRRNNRRRSERRRRRKGRLLRRLLRRRSAHQRRSARRSSQRKPSLRM